MKNFVLLLLFFSFSVLPQEKLDNYVEPLPEKKNTSSEKSPRLAALLGIVPGLGQAYVGNYYSGAGQGLMSFASASVVEIARVVEVFTGVVSVVALLTPGSTTTLFVFVKL